jgi:hypothetical protein
VRDIYDDAKANLNLLTYITDLAEWTVLDSSSTASLLAFPLSEWRNEAAQIQTAFFALELHMTKTEATTAQVVTDLRRHINHATASLERALHPHQWTLWDLFKPHNFHKESVDDVLDRFLLGSVATVAMLWEDAPPATLHKAISDPRRRQHYLTQSVINNRVLGGYTQAPEERTISSRGFGPSALFQVLVPTTTAQTPHYDKNKLFEFDKILVQLGLLDVIEASVLMTYARSYNLASKAFLKNLVLIAEAHGKHFGKYKLLSNVLRTQLDIRAGRPHAYAQPWMVVWEGNTELNPSEMLEWLGGIMNTLAAPF